MQSLKGIVPIVNTAFREDGSLDLESQRRLVRHLIGQNVHGLALFGTAGEGYTLSQEERDELMRVILREAGGRAPVVVSTGHTGTDVAAATSRDAEKAGADAVMVLPPYYLKPDGAGIFEYYQAISRAIHIPIMVQDAPLMTGVAIPAALLARMGRELENVRYAKIEAPPTAPKISELAAQDAGGMIAFGGLNGNFLIEELDRGAMGSMPGSDLCAGFVRMWNAYRAGDRARARSEFRRYLPMIRYELQPGLGVSAMKHNLAAEGVLASSRVRHPTRALDAAGQKELAELRAEIQSQRSDEPRTEEEKTDADQS